MKEALLDRFRSYLEELDEDGQSEPATPRDGGETADLFSVFAEIAALRNETRAQSRLTKDALDQFRAVFDTLQANCAALEQELKAARVREKEQIRAALKPVLLEMIDVRDRLVAGVAASPPQAQTSGLKRWLFKAPSPDAAPWREGTLMTLRRLDQALAARRVSTIAVVGRPFLPSVARAVSTVDDPSVAEGIVVAELRAGFKWEDEVLRLAEVTVARRHSAGRLNQGDAI